MAGPVQHGEWDLKVVGHDRKWKAGKGVLFKVVLALEDPKVKLELVSGNPEIFKVFPQDQQFTVRVFELAQETLDKKEKEDEEE